MWLLHEDTARALVEARRAGLVPTAEQREEFEKRALEPSANAADPRNMRRAGSVAEVRVEGVLTKKPDIFAMWFGGGNTTYASIESALAIAQSDASIKEVVLFVDSPGGSVDGLFEAIAAIENFKSSGKKLSVRASQAQSAAYGIAAAAGPITAATPGAFFGSVGTAVSYWVDDSIVDLTNSESPDKRPDVRTPEGKAVVVKLLDAINDLFVDAIARGRGTTKDDVLENFGRGATVLAGEAKKLGMIDAFAKPALRAVGGTRAETNPAAVPAAHARKTMDEKELKSQHPDLYAVVLEAGKKLGADEEHDRVCAMLTLGEKSGDMKTAHSAIRERKGLTLDLQATFMAAAMNRRDRDDRQTDSATAGAAVDGAKPAPAPAAEDLGDKIVALMEEERKALHA